MTTTSVTIKIGTSPNILTFTGTQVKACSIVEEVDPVALTLPHDTLDFELYSATGAFDIVNPTGLYANLKDKEVIDVWETVDGIDIYQGRFYLKDWDAPTPNSMVLSAVDAIGLLTESNYHGGLWVSGLPPITNVIEAEDLIIEIVEDAAGLTYEMDPDLNGAEELTGYFPFGDCRTALQHVLIRIGAYATCAGSDTIQIKKFDLPADEYIDLVLSGQQKGSGSSILLRPKITQIELDYHTYEKTTALDNDGDGNYDTNTRILFDGSLTTGDYIFYPEEIAMHYGYIAGKARTATITGENATPTYYSFTCTVAGTWNLVMEGFFKHNKWPYYVGTLTGRDNVLTVEDATMVDVSSVDTIANLLYDYSQLRYKVKTRTFGMGGIRAGQIVWIDTHADGLKVRGIVTKVTKNLSHGFVCELEIVGDVAKFDDLEDVLYPGKWDDDFAGISYLGINWGDAAAAGAYGGHVQYVHDGGVGEARFIMYGSQFTMIYSQLTDRGYVNVYVDDVLVDSVSENGASDYQHEWASAVYTNDFHVIRLEHGENSGGLVTDLDAVEVIGYFLPGKYDDRAFKNLWDHSVVGLAYNAGFLSTQGQTIYSPLSHLEVDFYGLQIRIGYLSWGNANVVDLNIQIDGGSIISVNTNNGLTDKIPLIWTSDELTLDTHTLKIWGGDGSGGTYILLDFIEFLKFAFIEEYWAWEFGDGIAWESGDNMEVDK